MTSPLAVTISKAATWVARLPLCFAGAVGGCGAGSGDGDVRERGEIVEGEAFCVDVRSELAVSDVQPDGDGAGIVVDVETLSMVRAERNSGLLSAM